jgi:hypothetical protein
MKRKFTVGMLFLITATCLHATTYYLDATGGNDSNSGNSVEKAWKSLEKVKSLALKPGDKVLLKKGEIFHGELHIQGKGEANNPVIIDRYGTAVANPCIKGYDHSLYAVCVFNSEYVEVRNLEIVNTGNERLPNRTGIKVHLNNYGIACSTTLKGLYIHDVNGSLVKNKGGGSGILIVNGGKEVLSAFNGLLIEDCTIRRCERNAMIWESGYSSRRNWFPNRNVAVRKNLIDQVPGDGIVPIGCVNTLIEYNKMQNCPALLPETEAAAGIWPWSCDSTLIQYNEACEHKAPWDAQGFDSDDNCTYTTFQYNYSHDNEGGFILICHGEGDKSHNIGVIGTVIKYNISINDAIRRHYTRRDCYFSPTIHISGSCIDSYIGQNIFHISKKPDANVDRRIIVSDGYGEYADRTVFKENIFYTAEPSAFDMTKSTNDVFDGNYYLGIFRNMPKDPNRKTALAYYQKYVENDPSGFHFLSNLMDTCMIADGKAELRYVKKEAIEELFTQISRASISPGSEF